MGGRLQHQAAPLRARICHTGGLRCRTEKARGCFAPHSRWLRYSAPCFTCPCRRKQSRGSNRNWMQVGGQVRSTPVSAITSIWNAISSTARHSKSAAPRRLLSGVRSLPELPISKTHLHRGETSSHPADNTPASVLFDSLRESPASVL